MWFRATTLPRLVQSRPDLVAASAERDARRVDALHEREARDFASDHSVAALREALPVASVEDDSASADVAHHAVRDDDSCAVRADLDAGPRDALDGAVRDQHVVAVAENEPRAASERDGASAQRLAAAVLEQQHGVVAPRERHGPCGDVSAGRDEEEGPAVEYPLARGVEEAAVVDGVEAALLLPPARLADSELVAVCEADASVLHGRDAQHLEGPVVRPVSGERIAVRRKVLHDDVVLPLEGEPFAVGLASERLRLAAEVERRIARRAGPSAAPQLARLDGHAELREVAAERSVRLADEGLRREQRGRREQQRGERGHGANASPANVSRATPLK